jgi:hypothetical protein
VLAASALAVREHARLAYDLRPAPPGLASAHAGSAAATITIAQTGRYAVEIGGDIGRPLRLIVDGRRIGTVSDELGPPGQLTPVATVQLRAGAHAVAVVRPGNDLGPGDGVDARSLGPVLFLASTVPGAVAEIGPTHARELCGLPLDWVEVVR